MKNPKHEVKIVSIHIFEVGRDDGEAHPSDQFELGFKCEVRRSTVVEKFTRGELQPLMDFMKFEKMSQLRGYYFGVEPEDRETIGFRKLLAQARVAMTPLESLFDRARTFQDRIGATDLNALNPRAIENLLREVFKEDGLFGPIGQLFQELTKKPSSNGDGMKQPSDGYERQKK